MSERSGGEAAIDLSSFKKHLGNRIITRSMTGSDNKTKNSHRNRFGITFRSDCSRARVGLSESAQFLDSVSFRLRPEVPELVLPKCRLPLLGPELACRRWVDSLRSDWSTSPSESESFTLRWRLAVLARLAAIVSRGYGLPELISESLAVTLAWPLPG